MHTFLKSVFVYGLHVFGALIYGIYTHALGWATRIKHHTVHFFTRTVLYDHENHFCAKFKRAFKSSFSMLTKMLEKAENAFSPNLYFLRLAVFKILQFKLKHFFLALVLPFC